MATSEKRSIINQLYPSSSLCISAQAVFQGLNEDWILVGDREKEI